MTASGITQLIINSPYEEPARHWRYERETRLFDLVEGRRPAGYVVASPDSRAFDDPGIFLEIPWSIRFARASRRGARRAIRA